MSDDQELSPESPGPIVPSPTLLARSKTAPPPLHVLETEIEASTAGAPVTASPPVLASTPPQVVDVVTSEPESALPSGNVTPATYPSALRRVDSLGSTGSAPNFKEKDKKRLRFTALEAGQGALRLSGTEDYYYPGTPSMMEEGRSKGKKGIPRDQAEYLSSVPGTPNISETADQIRRTLSLASLDKLLLVSTDSSHRERVIAGVQKAGRELVWRDSDEEKLFPRDYERALVLAAKRGLRSLILAWSVRSGVNVALLVFRSIRKTRPRVMALLRAILGPESYRFGLMIGTFTFLNTLTLHLLRLAPPLAYFRKRYRFGIFNEPSFGPPQREGAEGERRWQAAVAGAVGSLGLLWETAGRRTGVAQQMFVRGLQASYNQYTPRYGIRIPHGDMLLFGACCGQIMFAWLLSPETIPQAYSKWILNASRVPDFAVKGNRTIMRQGYLEPLQVQRALDFRATTPRNRGVLEDIRKRLRDGWQPAAVPCEIVHPWVDSCRETNFRRFFSVVRLMLPVYSALHIIPTLVLRRHHVRRDPLRMLLRVVLGITRSCSFLGVFVVIYQSLFCLRAQTLARPDLSKLWRDIISRKEVFWMMGFSTCLSLLVEEKKRRAELAMYVLPRALESAWSTARKRAWVPIVPFGETILGAAAMGMVMDAYKHQPTALSGVVRKLLFQLVGPV